MLILILDWSYLLGRKKTYELFISQPNTTNSNKRIKRKEKKNRKQTNKKETNKQTKKDEERFESRKK